MYKLSPQKDNSNIVRYLGQKVLFDNEKNEECKELTGVHASCGEEELKALYSDFFYTLISNQSIYAYNTLDFKNECNSNEKESSVLGNSQNAEFDIEDRCWLHGLFHKNDAYRTPLVITPFRREGNIDINNERKLAIERLVRLYTHHEDLRIINDHLLAERTNGIKSITVNVDRLVDKFEIHTTNLSNDLTKVKEAVAETLLSALNDTNLATS